MNPGLIHLYHGEGKGKTTAAMGLALRALGHGEEVVVLQFLKDGKSGESGPLGQLGAVMLAGNPGGRFTWEMPEAERAAVRERQNRLLQEAAAASCGLLVLDEACAALQEGLLDEELLKTTVLDRPPEREVVLTGRCPAAWMLEAADYITEMRGEKHPYEQGIPAREGIEF